MVKLANKPTDLTSAEMITGLVAAVSHADSIVGTVLLEALGFKMTDTLSGKIASDFIKNLILPISVVDPQARFQQKQRFHRVYNAWDKILINIVNPGNINASDLILTSRTLFFGLKDLKADRLPLGIKARNLTMSCNNNPTHPQKNSEILTKISELKPQLPAIGSNSYNPCPGVTWTTTMRNWAKDTLPKQKPSQYQDVSLPNDPLSTNASQKEYSYSFNDSGNRQPIRKQAKLSEPNIGSSGVSVWELYQNNI
jgi:hypothetical protein